MRTVTRTLISLATIAGLAGVLKLADFFGSGGPGRDSDYRGAVLLIAALGILIVAALEHMYSKAVANADDTPDEAPQETPDNLDEQGQEPATPLCPSCLAPVKRLQMFCDECCSPLTSNAEIDPVGRIRSIGCMVSNAASAPPRRIILIGIWLIFAVPVGLLLFLIGSLGPPDSYGLLDTILRMVLMLGTMSLYIAIVVKATRNYFRKKSELDSAPAEHEDTVGGV